MRYVKEAVPVILWLAFIAWAALAFAGCTRRATVREGTVNDSGPQPIPHAEAVATFPNGTLYRFRVRESGMAAAYWADCYVFDSIKGNGESTLSCVR